MKHFLFIALIFVCLISATLAAPPKGAKKPQPLAPPLPALPSVPLPALPSAPSATIPASSDDVLLYNGQALSDAGLTVSGWGGGSAAESTDVSLSGGHSLKVTTLDPYQGAVLSFSKPVDLGSLNADKTRTLVLAMRPADVTRHFPAPPRRTSPAPGSPDNSPPADDTGGGITQGLDGTRALMRTAQWGGAHVRLAQYGGGQDFSGLSTLRNLHLLLTFAGGKQIDVMRPYPVPADGDNDRWAVVGVPLAALHAPDGPASLQSLSVAGDDYAAFYVGQIKITRDTASITCFAGDEQRVQADEPVTLTASASGGLSALRYSWDFDASDGVTAQGEGRTATTQYAKGGRDYTVTLTVTDIDGLKTPAVSTTVIHVQ